MAPYPFKGLLLGKLEDGHSSTPYEVSDSRVLGDLRPEKSSGPFGEGSMCNLPYVASRSRCC